ncbi:membrane protein insertase YidC [Pseudomonas canadensis]|uniref:membrane protein insertase YidC n=1 Tax=Pseudomonas canadensis TaxID=915099 RepID=UPI002892BA54|nr:membrane protein insertase YidC [Pseudomonas canadensis]WNJ83936.1 membrane protein insertase YidC [Pseudomonas canadensis]
MSIQKKSMPSVFYLWLLMFMAPFAFATAPAQVSPSLADSNVQLSLDLTAGTVSHWRLPQVMNAQGQPQDLAMPAGQLFALKGRLQGKTLEEWTTLAGGWKTVAADSGAVTIALDSAELPFVIRKTWRLTNTPSRVRFELSLQSRWQAKQAQDALWLELGPGLGEQPTHGLGMGQAIYSFTEVVYRNAEGVSTQRLGHDDNVRFKPSAGQGVTEWAGLQSRYFALLLIPEGSTEGHLEWEAQAPATGVEYPQQPDFETLLRVNIPLPEAHSESSQILRWDVFGGGKSYDVLSAQEPTLTSLLFAGLWEWMRALILGIMYVLAFIHKGVGNWGVSVILLSILVRLVMYPVAKNAMAAQKKFAAIQERIQPELQEIRRNYKGGEQSERILELYEAHQVSPLAGLKPLLIVLIQIPIFVALYHLLGQAFELRNEPFLWIQTLAQPDQLFSFGVDIPFFGAYFNLLPVLMALSTLLSIKFSQTVAANAKEAFRQQFFLWLMALVFFLLFYSFPSGMVLYWTMANILQFVHQQLASRK